jgi:hypothetical protein
MRFGFFVSFLLVVGGMQILSSDLLSLLQKVEPTNKIYKTQFKTSLDIFVAQKKIGMQKRRA